MLDNIVLTQLIAETGSMKASPTVWAGNKTITQVGIQFCYLSKICLFRSSKILVQLDM